MANSFNIDVKPEIAAVAADIAAAIVTVNANSSGLATTIISDLVDINTAIGNSETAVLESITTNLALTNAKIDVNLVAIDIIDGIADAIKLKTDLLPQSFRGTFTPVGSFTASATYITIVNITDNSGKLLFIVLKNGADSNLTFRLTIDGNVSNELTHNTVDLVKYVVPQYATANDLRITLQDNPFTIPFEFSTSLKLEYKRTAGSSNPSCNTAYNLD